ncbi:hypothetical protein PoB_006655500 [Plakobranchus ocellatus]|uniref:Uncharacterized protein n=1 Tax=Plakobranchus ocellatus TaxID=259542 RepID=A0AAV4D7U2_9GAST|nr:hypothetical protein PoB_006655500 [Plakobranchus ocellatus]
MGRSWRWPPVRHHIAEHASARARSPWTSHPRYDKASLASNQADQELIHMCIAFLQLLSVWRRNETEKIKVLNKPFSTADLSLSDREQSLRLLQLFGIRIGLVDRNLNLFPPECACGIWW